MPSDVAHWRCECIDTALGMDVLYSFGLLSVVSIPCTYCGQLLTCLEVKHSNFMAVSTCDTPCDGAYCALCMSRMSAYADERTKQLRV
jgi:hypothetical protein